jgi:hypothetical protein
VDFVLSRAKWNSIYPGKGKFNIFLQTQIEYIVAAGLPTDGGQGMRKFEILDCPVEPDSER